MTKEEYKKQLYDKEVKEIHCIICTKTVQKKNGGLPRHLTTKHDYSMEQYLKRYVLEPIDYSCSVCGKETNYNYKKWEFRPTCSKKCNLKATREEREKTFTKKYGHKTPFKNEEIQKKITNNLLKKHGVTNVSQIEEVKEEKKKTLENTMVERKKDNEKELNDYLLEKEKAELERQYTEMEFETLQGNFEDDDDGFTPL